ncbi:MAG: hypothetical protein H0U49_06310 [Parachlamydiaceae bacterium]|nr:hypothetical protein [Parachlamydiaceae bacterium]
MPYCVKPPQDYETGEKPSVILAGGFSVPWHDEFRKLLSGTAEVLYDLIGPENIRPYSEHLAIEKADILLMSPSI